MTPNPLSELGRLTRAFTFVLSAFVSSLHAQPEAAVSSETGSITGVAIDSSTAGVLASVSVSLPDQGVTVLTDRNGRYVLTNLAPGTYALEASYLGRSAIRLNVVVAAGTETKADLDFGSEVVRLTTFVVEGYREGWAKALQQKKTSANIGEIVSSDSLGNLPDRNVADALARLPGVALIADSGEGQFVTIRGLNPNLNNVTLNGATLASPGIRNLDGRDSVSGSVIPLDVIGSANIAQIELTKTLTPDMDASAIGGSVNLRTASAFDRRGRFLQGSVTGGYSDYARDQIYEGDISYGDRFGRERGLGLALTANYSYRPFRTEAFQSVWQNAAFGDGRFVPIALELLPEDALRKRVGLTSNIEYRPGAGRGEYYVTTVYNRFDEENTRQEAITRSNNALGAFGGPNTVIFNNTRAEHRVFHIETEQTQLNTTAGSKHTFGDLTLQTETTFSNGGQSRPHMRSIQFRNSNIQANPGFTMDYSSFIPKISRGTSTFADPARFTPLRTYDERSVEVNEDIFSGRADLTWAPASLATRRITFKTGVKWLNNERSADVNAQIYGASFNMADTGAVIPGQNVMGYNTEIDLDYNKALAFVESRRSSLVLDRGSSLSSSAANTFKVSQDIWAGYGMASAQFDKLNVLGGVRVEATSASIRALEYRSVGSAVGSIFPNDADFEYSNVLPNLQARYEVSRETIFRAAITSTIRRPEYEFAAPSSRLQFSFSGGAGAAIIDPVNFPNLGLLTIGNSKLKPYEAMNYDVAVEHYLKSGGIIALSAFHKTVSNPIYQTLELRQNTVYNGLGFQELQVSSFRNGSDGKIRGLEVSAQVPLNFLPAPFDGFGIDGNITWVGSSVQVESRPGVKLKFFEQPDRATNLALYYQKYRFSARFAYTYQTESLRQIGTDVWRDFYRADRYQTDAQASYKLSDALTLFANVQNITNQPQDTYQGSPNWLRFRRTYGWNGRVGIRFNY
jgi:TonB-dependent receptor